MVVLPKGTREFLAAVWQLRAGDRGKDVPVGDIADHLGWEFVPTQLLAADLTELGMVESDMGCGFLPTVIEGEA